LALFAKLPNISKSADVDSMTELTRRQRQIFDFLRDNYERFAYPPTLDELCEALGMASRGSLHKHISALTDAGLLEPFVGSKQSRIRLTVRAQRDYAACEYVLPYIGKIAAGKPIEDLADVHYLPVPELLKSDKPCYVLQVKGDSMKEAGIFDDLSGYFVESFQSRLRGLPRPKLTITLFKSMEGDGLRAVAQR
jgi:SOS-response transcriptional repressor LexA